MEREPSPAGAATAEHVPESSVAHGGGGGAPTFTARGSIPAIAKTAHGNAATAVSASDQAYGGGAGMRGVDTPFTATFSKARDPLVRAQADAATIHSAPTDQRAGLLSKQLASDIDVLVYQCALARLCAAEWASVKTKPPAGVDVGQIDAGAGQIAPAQQAAAKYDEGWMSTQDRVWAEVYFATYIARHGAADLNKQLNRLGSGGPARSLAGHILGFAERDGLLTAAQVTAATAPATYGATPATDIEEAATQTVGENMASAKERFDKAQAALKALDDKLQLELHEIGPALYDPNETDPKKIDDATRRVQAYIRQYQSSPEYVKARAECTAAAKQLGLEAGQVGDDLLAHGHVTGADDNSAAARKSVLDTYEALAGSEGGAMSAVSWAQSHLADPNLDATERGRVTQISMLGQTTDATYKLQRVQQMMQDAAANPTGAGRKQGLDAAIAFIQTNICTPYADIKNIQGLTKLSQKLLALKTNVAITQALASHDAAEAFRIAQSFVADAPAEADTIVRRVWAGMGSLIGLFNGSQTMLAGADPLKLFNTSKAMSDDLIALKGLFHGTAEITDATQRAQALELVKKIHGGFSDLKTLGFGILNLAGSVMAIDAEWGVAQAHTDNLALQVQLAADIASAVGSALALCPPLAPLGEIISICGSVVSMIAGFFVGDVEGDDRRKQEKQILSQPGIMPGSPVVGPPGPSQLGLADTFTAPEAGDNLNAAQAAGLTLTQIQDLGQRASWLFHRHGAISGIDALLRYAARHPELGTYSSVPTLYQVLTTGLDAGLKELADRTDSWQDLLNSDGYIMNVEAMVVILGMTIPNYYTANDA